MTVPTLVLSGPVGVGTTDTADAMAVQERLKSGGSDPSDPAVVQKIYEGMFRRIERTHPLDYYWFWTPEGWTWEGVDQRQVDATITDFRAAMEAAKEVGDETLTSVKTALHSSVDGAKDILDEIKK